MPELKQVNLVTNMPKAMISTGNYTSNYSMTRAAVRRTLKVEKHETTLGILNPGKQANGASRAHPVPAPGEANRQRKIGNAEYDGGKSGMSGSERIRKCERIN